MWEDLQRLAREIAALKQVVAALLTLRQGVVVAHTAGPPASMTVTLGGSSTQIAGVRYLGWYSPVNGDTVWCLRWGAGLVSLGKLA